MYKTRKYYEANPSYYKERANANKRKLREFVDELKSAPCSDCGYTYPPYVMQFDHIGLDKAANISTLVANGASKLLHEELKKCELVCANCHAIRTHTRRAALA